MEFAYLTNPTDFDFTFQHDAVPYTVPARRRVLFLKAVAEHGEKRSHCLSDPEFDKDGNLSSAGNRVMRRCYSEPADTASPVGISEPVVIEEARENAAEIVETKLGDSGVSLRAPANKRKAFRMSDMPGRRKVPNEPTPPSPDSQL